MNIGIDFDNTIISYDKVFYRYALVRKWIDPSVAADKNAIRHAIRMVHGNDVWTELQSIVYSKGVAEATMADGFADFFSWAQLRGIACMIISHKTQKSAWPPHVDLRTPAKHWLEKQGLGTERGVYFEETKEMKLERIRSCECTHFIDDLEEFLMEKDFPQNTKRIHYVPHLQAQPFMNKSVPAPLLTFSHWKEIQDYFENLVND